MASVTPGEQRILDLWEQGRSFQHIARKLGITAKKARQTVTLYDAGPKEQRREEDRIRKGSERLAAQIALARKLAA